MADKDVTGQKDEIKSLADDPAFQELQRTVRGLAIVVQEAQKQSAQTQEVLKSLQSRPAEPAPKDEPVDFDSMSNAELFKLMTTEIGKIVDTKLGDLDKKVVNTRKELQESRISSAVKEFASQKKDFWEWADEIKGYARAHPTLEISELYDMARRKDPEKAKKMDEKHFDADTKPQKTPFGGLTPTSSTKGASDDEGSKMSAKDAADKAWDDVMADISPELLGSSD